MRYTLAQLLKDAVKRNASDLHINADRQPQFRVDGRLIPAGDAPLTRDDARELCFESLNQSRIDRLESEREIDLSFEVPGLCRFRANIYWSLDTISGAFRPIPFIIPDPGKLGIPKTIFDLTKKVRGLILITGPTGAGKSTTLATMIDHINDHRPCHIVTLEDPVEFVFKPRRATVSQREVEKDTLSFTRGLKYILRQDPDVVLIGEMRDLETIQSALTVAETGHLVLATLHTNNAVQTIDRIIDVFPPHQQQQVRTQLSFVLEAVVSQQLLPGTKSGRLLATEIMIPHSGIRNTIREGKTHQIPSQMQTGQTASGMHTMDQSLANLVRTKAVQKDDAFAACIDPEVFLSLLQ